MNGGGIRKGWTFWPASRQVLIDDQHQVPVKGLHGLLVTRLPDCISLPCLAVGALDQLVRSNNKFAAMLTAGGSLPACREYLHSALR